MTTFVELNGEPFVVEPPVTVPAGGMILWAPNVTQFGIYDADGRLLILYTRVDDVFLGARQ